MVSDAFKDEAVVIRKVTQKQLPRWYIARNKKILVIPTPPPALAVTGSIVNRERQRLLYFREQGVVSYDFAAKKEELLLPFDTNLFRVRKFWLDNKEDVLYFLRERYSPQWKVILTNLKKRKAAEMKVAHSLLVYSFKTGVCRVIVDFDDSLSHGIADVRSGVFYALLKQKILIIDLHSGRTLKELPEPNIIQICLAPDNKVLVCGQYASFAYKLNNKGVKAASIYEGLASSFSGDGKHRSFWKKNMEFHVATSRSKSECALISTQMNSDDIIRFQPALWCPSNKHLALPLYIQLPGNHCDTALCIFNVEKKTATFCSSNVLDYNWL